MPVVGIPIADKVVLIGGSAGGVEAISTVVAGLPGDLAAAVLVVLHVPSFGTSVFPAILDRVCALPVAHAADRDPLRPGRVYVAPPDHHLLVEYGRARLSRSPKENGVRPAIDTLFRSAAHGYGPGVVAVLVSGTLDDGTSGLVTVKRHGGATVVQDPADALFPGMPESAVRYASPEHVLPLAEIAPLVTKLLGESPGRTPDEPIEEGTMPTEPTDSARASASDQGGVPSELNCPDCGGTLWGRTEGQLLRFRCRVGHAYSPDSLFSSQLESLESALWAAVVALHERADLAIRLAHRMEAHGYDERARRYTAQAEDARRRADQVRSAIFGLSRGGEPGEDEVLEES